MKKIWYKLLAICLCTLIIISAGADVLADGIPVLPHSFYGTVTINGEDAPAGTVVSAVVSSGNGSITTTTAGQYGGPGAADAKLIVQGTITDGATITFYVEGVSTGQTAIYHSGEVTELNLEATIQYNLTVTRSIGGNVTSPGIGIYAYDYGEVVNLIASANDDYIFTGWSGDTSGIANVNNASTTITMHGNYSVRANFRSTITTVATTEADEIIIVLFGESNTYNLNRNGDLQGNVSEISNDRNFKVIIEAGTRMLDRDGDLLTYLMGDVDENPPDTPDNTTIIGLAYTFLPSGAVFNPGITFEFKYNEVDIPDGVNEEDLVIAYYDSDTDEWVKLDCDVDVVNNTITATITHLTTFAVVARDSTVSEADFTLSDLTVTPGEVMSGEQVTITVTVTNEGNVSGTYTVVLKISGVVEASNDITLDAGESGDVSFTVVRTINGYYSVTIGGLSDSFVVTTTSTTTEMQSQTITYTQTVEHPVVTSLVSTVTLTTGLQTALITTVMSQETTTFTTVLINNENDDETDNWLKAGLIVAVSIIVIGSVVFAMVGRRRY